MKYFQYSEQCTNLVLFICVFDKSHPRVFMNFTLSFVQKGKQKKSIYKRSAAPPASHVFNDSQ